MRKSNVQYTLSYGRVILSHISSSNIPFFSFFLPIFSSHSLSSLSLLLPRTRLLAPEDLSPIFPHNKKHLGSARRHRSARPTRAFTCRGRLRPRHRPPPSRASSRYWPSPICLRPHLLLRSGRLRPKPLLSPPAVSNLPRARAPMAARTSCSQPRRRPQSSVLLVGPPPTAHWHHRERGQNWKAKRRSRLGLAQSAPVSGNLGALMLEPSPRTPFGRASRRAGAGVGFEALSNRA